MKLYDYLDELEKHHIEAALASKPNRREAADALGISLRTLYYKLKRHQVVPPKLKAPKHPDVRHSSSIG